MTEKDFDDIYCVFTIEEDFSGTYKTLQALYYSKKEAVDHIKEKKKIWGKSFKYIWEKWPIMRKPLDPVYCVLNHYDDGSPDASYNPLVKIFSTENKAIEFILNKDNEEFYSTRRIQEWKLE